VIGRIRIILGQTIIGLVIFYLIKMIYLLYYFVLFSFVSKVKVS
jgi:hypothetical protein